MTLHEQGPEPSTTAVRLRTVTTAVLGASARVRLRPGFASHAEGSGVHTGHAVMIQFTHHSVSLSTAPPKEAASHRWSEVRKALLEISIHPHVATRSTVCARKRPSRLVLIKMRSARPRVSQPMPPDGTNNRQGPSSLSISRHMTDGVDKHHDDETRATLHGCDAVRVIFNDTKAELSVKKHIASASSNENRTFAAATANGTMKYAPTFHQPRPSSGDTNTQCWWIIEPLDMAFSCEPIRYVSWGQIASSREIYRLKHVVTGAYLSAQPAHSNNGEASLNLAVVTDFADGTNEHQTHFYLMSLPEHRGGGHGDRGNGIGDHSSVATQGSMFIVHRSSGRMLGAGAFSVNTSDTSTDFCSPALSTVPSTGVGSNLGANLALTLSATFSLVASTDSDINFVIAVIHSHHKLHAFLTQLTLVLERNGVTGGSLARAIRACADKGDALQREAHAVISRCKGEVVQTLETMICDCVAGAPGEGALTQAETGTPIKAMQCKLHEQGTGPVVVQLLSALLLLQESLAPQQQIGSASSSKQKSAQSDAHTSRKLACLCISLLRVMVRGYADAQKDVAAHQEDLMKHVDRSISSADSVKRAADEPADVRIPTVITVLRETFTDNAQLLGIVDPQFICRFIHALVTPESLNEELLQFLSTLCTCHGVPVPRMQYEVAHALFANKENESTPEGTEKSEAYPSAADPPASRMVNGIFLELCVTHKDDLGSAVVQVAHPTKNMWEILDAQSPFLSYACQAFELLAILCASRQRNVCDMLLAKPMCDRLGVNLKGLRALVVSTRSPPRLQSAALALLRSLFVDREPHEVRSPIEMTRCWYSVDAAMVRGPATARAAARGVKGLLSPTQARAAQSQSNLIDGSDVVPLVVNPFEAFPHVGQLDVSDIFEDMVQILRNFAENFGPSAARHTTRRRSSFAKQNSLFRADAFFGVDAKVEDKNDSLLSTAAAAPAPCGAINVPSDSLKLVRDVLKLAELIVQFGVCSFEQLRRLLLPVLRILTMFRPVEHDPPPQGRVHGLSSPTSDLPASVPLKDAVIQASLGNYAHLSSAPLLLGNIFTSRAFFCTRHIRTLAGHTG